MRKKVSPSSDQIAAVTAELAAMKARQAQLERVLRGERIPLLDSEIAIGQRYCVRTGPSRNRMVTAVVIDRAKWERQGHFVYLLQKDKQGSGPSTYARRAGEIYPCEEGDGPEGD